MSVPADGSNAGDAAPEDKRQEFRSLFRGTSQPGALYHKERQYSLFRDMAPDKSSPGIAETHRQYNAAMYDQLEQSINQYLAQKMMMPEGYKLSKPSKKTTITYGGSTKYSDLEDFVLNLCINYLMKGLGGNLDNPQEDNMDKTHIFVLQYHLTGEAKDMYNRHVMSINHIQTFMQGIPSVMSEYLMFNKGLSPKVNSIEDFVEHALNYEHCKDISVFFQKQIKGRMSNMSSETVLKTSSKLKTAWVLKKFSAGHDRIPAHKLRHPSMPRKAGRQSDNKPYKKNMSFERTKDNPSVAQPCQKCGAINHWADKCPQDSKGRSYLKAAHTIAEGGNELNYMDNGSRENPSDESNNEANENEPQEAESSKDEYVEVEVIDSDYGSDVDENYKFGAMIHETNDDKIIVTGLTVEPSLAPEDEVKRSKNEKVKIRRVTLLKHKDKIMCPQAKPSEKQCLTTLIDINGIGAWTLWDSESTTTGITLSFTHVAGIKVHDLMDPHMLQLGTVGSCSTINFGANIETKIGDAPIKTYVDIGNFDHYDMIIGMLFMQANNVVLDFVKNEVRMGSQVYKVKKPPDKYTKSDIPTLRKKWFKENQDIMQGPPEKLPPFHEVNHKIKLIDGNKRYKYHLPHCPQSLRNEFHDKLVRYVRAKWWELCSMDQAAPLLCILKKDGQLRTITDVRFHNDNTIKDMTPLLDQEVI
ncbi:hypothetical protein AN958_11660 [Leucoagaricus sp. SymC.cos]|nr:hypothetical protein AN958_11660 [Leucoagaricus sp. SymC.cos]